MSKQNAIDTPTKAVIYARFSSSGQREESIEGQVRDCTKYAEDQGLSVVATYADRAMSGTTDKRPDFQRMIKDSERGQFQYVICWKNDRFVRDRYDAAIYKAQLKKNGVRLLYAKETIPEGPEGIIFESIMEGYAEYYSANLSQNIQRGNYDSALKRQTLGQNVYGLRKGADKRFEIDPATTPIVRRIFSEYAAGKSSKKIYQDLNAEGYRTQYGNLWQASSIQRILRNEKYVGIYTYKNLIRDDKGIPPIIEKELWEKVQKMLDKNRQAPAAKKTEGGFLLTGKLFCGRCGALMIGDSGTSRSGHTYEYYTCAKRKNRKSCKKESVRKEWIEDLIVQKLSDIISSDDAINEIADKFMEWQAAQQKVDPAAALRKELAATHRAIQNNLALVDAGVITDEIKAHLVDLSARKTDLEHGIAMAEISKPRIEREAIIWFLKSFRDGDIQNARWRIHLVDTFLAAAYLYDDKRLHLVLNYSGEDAEVTMEIAEDAVITGDLLCSSIISSGAPHVVNSNHPSGIFFKDGLLVVQITAH